MSDAYLYGFVRADGPARVGARGVGDPPAPVEVWSHGSIAALVSRVDRGFEPAAPDVRAHATVLAEIIEQSDVLPLQFGTRATEGDAVRLMDERAPEIEAALAQVTDRVEARLTVSYDEEALITEIARGDSAVARARRRVRTVADRIRLGEAVAKAIETAKSRDREWLQSRLAPLARGTAEQAGGTHMTVMDASVLLERRDVDGFEQAVDAAADAMASERGRPATFRILAPLPPYSFARLGATYRDESWAS